MHLNYIEAYQLYHEPPITSYLAAPDSIETSHLSVQLHSMFGCILVWNTLWRKRACLIRDDPLAVFATIRARGSVEYPFVGPSISSSHRDIRDIFHPTQPPALSGEGESMRLPFNLDVVGRSTLPTNWGGVPTPLRRRTRSCRRRRRPPPPPTLVRV